MARNPVSAAVVSPTAALQKLYPYVFVNGDRSVRELHSEERKYLETPFSPFDGARPYIKQDYDSRNGWKSLEGFCPRAKIPNGLVIADAPSDNPMPPMSKGDIIESLRKKATGFDVTEQPDGTVTIRRVSKK
jgi:hypothetical protein